MRWLGVIARNSGLNWSPAPILTGITLYSRPNSSRAMCTLWPFGVGHDQTSIIGSSGLRSGSDGASLAGLVPLGEAFEPAARGTVAQPFLEMVAPELFVKRQFADEPQDEAAIFFGRDPYRDMAHRSRHSRGPLPGGPKSLGARPAWNQVTKL